MESHEKYCATHLSISESEQFFAIGDAQVTRFLNHSYEQDRDAGIIRSLPDLLSLKRVGPDTFFRLREVKFKLEKRLVDKAISQLESGIKWLNQRFLAPSIDRIEIVIPLRDRKIKPNEVGFLGAKLAENRFWLNKGSHTAAIEFRGHSYPVSILLV